MKHVLIRVVDERAQRIVDTAIDLAERDGYHAVRLRDVASQADVALGTLYRRFRSKEDILVAALERECGALQQRLEAQPVQGATALGRVTGFFEVATRGLCDKPNLARAVVRAVASAEPEITEKVAAFHSLISDLIMTALQGKSSGKVAPGAPSDEDGAVLAFVLQQVWFASLVGWAGGLHEEDSIAVQMETAAALMLNGLELS